jgi:2-methylcitrate dehydratase PrpD
MSTDLESQIADYLKTLVDRIRSIALSKEDRAIVRQHLLDAIASAFIGCRGKVFEDLIKLCPRISEGYAWPGSGKDRMGSIDAGMVWAFAINASVFEDGSREGACHPAAGVIPAVIAFSKGKDWEIIDRAIIAGYEVMIRLARCGNPEFTLKGFHPTAITAPFGAAVAASILLGHDLSRIRNAICLAAIGGSGLMASFMSGETQPLQIAWSVRNGIVAAMMAGASHAGYPRIIEKGFFPAYLGTTPHLPIDAPLEHEYAIHGSYLKTYPGCRHLHPSIDALSYILEENKIDPFHIRKIRVRTYKVAVETEIDDLNERGDAYFNLPYALAARVILGKNDWDAFGEKHFTNVHLVELMKKIEVRIDPEIESFYPYQRASIVEIHKVDGNILCKKVNYALGEPENPMPQSATREKFRKAAGSFLPKKSLDRIEGLLEISGPIESAHTLFDTLSENARGYQEK